MGPVPDPANGRNRVAHALIFTACYSRHCFVWLTFRQTTEAVIDGFEAAWAFFAGVLRVVIPDNMSPIVIEAGAYEPRFTDAFAEYSHARGFVIDAARVRTPTDKPRVERTVPNVRGNLFAEEALTDLADARRRTEHWCREVVGMPVHGRPTRRPRCNGTATSR